MNSMENEMDDSSPDALAQPCRYALHRENDSNKSISNLSNGTHSPRKVIRQDDAFNDDEYWYPLPGLRVPTTDTMQSWSKRWFHESAWPGMGLFG
jgi:hypothetical protein